MDTRGGGVGDGSATVGVTEESRGRPRGRPRVRPGVRQSGVTELLVLSEHDVRDVMSLDELAEAIRSALVALSENSLSVPTRIAARAPHGLLAAMPGYVAGLGLAAKLVSVFPGNAAIGRPSHQALIAVFDEDTGAPCALMDGTYITAVRTAVTSAVSAIALARPQPRWMAIIGSGVQAEAHIDTFKHLIGPDEIRVVTRSESSAKRIASRHPGILALTDLEGAVEGADIVCCCTDAAEPVIDDTWIKPGAFVCSVGSGRELPCELLARARVFVESRSTATAAIPAGAVELQGVDPASLTELGQVLSGQSRGFVGSEEIAVYKSTGHASEDVAAAAVVLRRATAGGKGTAVPLGW